MYKSYVPVMVFIYIIFCSNLFPQGLYSIQVSGGIISPISSSNGFTSSIQVSRSLNSNISFYVYSGYSAWDRNKIVFHEDYSIVQKQQYFNSYSSDNHILIPIHIGGRFNLHTNKLFTAYINAELGYCYLRYNSYVNMKSIIFGTGEVVGYSVIQATRKQIRENLIGIGMGAGISHPINEKINMILSFKLISYVNSNYYGLFSTKGTYATFSVGINYDI